MEDHKVKNKESSVRINYQDQIQRQSEATKQWLSKKPPETIESALEEHGWTLDEMRESGALDKFEKNGFK